MSSIEGQTTQKDEKHEKTKNDKITKNDLQIITQKTKDRATLAPLKTGGRLFLFLLSEYFNVAICHSICYIIKLATLNAFFSFDIFMVFIPECKQQLRTMK